MTRPRVLIADDHPHILARVSAILTDDYDIIAAVSNGMAAVQVATALRPDLIVLDVSMPIMTGFEAAARIGDDDWEPRIVFLTVHEDPEFVEAARDVGADGYVLKRAVATALLPAIRTVLAGQTVFPELPELSHADGAAK